jgi:hypothetical protein
MAQVPGRGDCEAGFLHRWCVSLREWWRGSPGVDLLTKQLVSVIAEEAEHCERLLWLVRQQQSYMAGKNIGRLEANGREQERTVRRLRKLERRRLALIRLLAQMPSYNNNTRPDLTRLMAVLSDDYGRRFDQLCRVIGASLSQLVGIRERTAVLVERSRFHIGETSRHLGSIDAAGAYRAAPAAVDGRADGAGTRFAQELLTE